MAYTEDHRQLLFNLLVQEGHMYPTGDLITDIGREVWAAMEAGIPITYTQSFYEGNSFRVDYDDRPKFGGPQPTAKPQEQKEIWAF